MAVELLERLTRALNPVPSSLETHSIDPEIQDLIPDGLTPAAVLVPLIEVDEGWEVLLTLRTEHLKHHAGQIAFPGGRMESDDATPVAAALRETHEEVGIGPEQIQVVGSLDPFPTITGYQVVPVVGVVQPGYHITIDPNEVEQVFQAPLEFVLDPDNHLRQSAIFKGKRRHFYVIQYQEHTIWGATAAMLVNLSQRVRDH